MNLIVTMASYHERIETLPICLKTVATQTVKPKKVLLYLDQHYTKISSLCASFQKINIEIITVKKDLKSHNKYFYAMQEYPNDIIVTLDDDVLYPTDIISRLVESYYKYPFAVSAGRAHQIRFDTHGNIMPYNNWIKESDKYNIPRMDLFATGVGGVLYPPNCMDMELFNSTKIEQLCLYGDDIWLKAMQLLNGTPVVLIQQELQHPPIINGTEDQGLYKINKLQERNDIYIKKVFDEYNLTKERIFANEQY